MRNLILTLAVLFLITFTSNSQPLMQGEQALGFGIGVPATIHSNYTSTSPAFTAMYEYGFTEKVGIGYIGGGALVSFSGSKYEYQHLNNTYKNTYSYVTIGPRAAYHFDMVELTNNEVWSNIDVYGGVFLGLNFQKYKYTNHTTDSEEKNNTTKLTTDIFAGIRYGFNEKIGAFAELGFGVTYLNLGVNVRF